MSSRIRMVVLVVTFLLLVVTTIAVVPYRIDEKFINRRTGEISRVTVICLFDRSEPLIHAEDDLSAYGQLLAPSEWLLISKIVYPFPWSRSSMPNHWRAEFHAEHHALELLRRWSFMSAKQCNEIDKAMTEEQLATLIAKRLEQWNTLQVDRGLEKIAQEIQRENERMFPKATKGTICTVTVTTVIK
jgi:hypothetical protein